MRIYRHNDPSEFDDQGQLAGTCTDCGTNHDGHPPETFGGKTRCLRIQAEQAGLPNLVDQVDALRRDAVGDTTGQRIHFAPEFDTAIPPDAPTFTFERLCICLHTYAQHDPESGWHCRLCPCEAWS